MELIDMNNTAVRALQHGRAKQAHDLLSTALASLKVHFAKEGKRQVLQKSTISSRTNTPPPQPTTKETETPFPLQDHPRCVSNTSGAEYNWCGDKRSLGVDKEPMVPSVVSVVTGVISSHNDGLVLNYNKALMVLYSLDDLDVLTSIVLYNIALVKHGRAMTRGSSTLLTAALTFYKLSTQIIKNKPVVDKASDFVLLVSYHNMAHIYASQFYPEEMRVCFNAARLLLLAQASTHRFLDDDDIEFFSMSALLEVEDICLAPAA